MEYINQNITINFDKSELSQGKLFGKKETNIKQLKKTNTCVISPVVGKWALMQEHERINPLEVP